MPKIRNPVQLLHLPEIILFCAFVIVNLLIDGRLQSNLDIDSHRYLELGQRLLDTGRLEYKGITGKVIPEYSRTPAYPLLIAIFISLGGSSAIGIALVVWFQRLAWVLAVCWMLPRTLARSGRVRWYGFVGKFTLLFSPVVLYHGSMLLTDLLYAAGLLATMRLSTQTFRSGNKWMAFAAGMLHGLLILLRPVHLPAPMLACVPWVFKRTRLVIIILAVSLAMALGWMARNHSIHGSWSLAKLGGRAIALHQEAAINRMQPEQSAVKFGPEYIKAIQSTDEGTFTAAWILMRELGLSEATVDGVAGQVAVASIKLDPRNYLEQVVRNLGRLMWSKADGFSLARILNSEGSESRFAIAGLGNAIWSLMAFFLVPAWVLIRRVPRRLVWSKTTLMMGLVAAYMIVAPILTTVTYGRFTLPLLSFVGIAYCMADSGFRKRRNGHTESRLK